MDFVRWKTYFHARTNILDLLVHFFLLRCQLSAVSQFLPISPALEFLEFSQVVEICSETKCNKIHLLELFSLQGSVDYCYNKKSKRKQIVLIVNKQITDINNDGDGDGDGDGDIECRISSLNSRPIDRPIAR